MKLEDRTGQRSELLQCLSLRTTHNNAIQYKQSRDLSFIRVRQRRVRMRYICLVVLLVGQLSNAQLSSSTDGARKLKLSSAWKAIDTQLFYRTTNTPSSDPTAGIDGESPDEPVDDQTASEQPEQPMPTDEVSDSGSSEVQSPDSATGESRYPNKAGEGTYYGSNQVGSGDKPDSTEESKEPVYPTLGTATTYNNPDDSASEENKPADSAAEEAEDPANEKAEDATDEKAEDPADENSEDPDTDKVRSIPNFMLNVFSPSRTIALIPQFRRIRTS